MTTVDGQPNPDKWAQSQVCDSPPPPLCHPYFNWSVRLLALQSDPLGKIKEGSKGYEWRDKGFPESETEGLALCSSKKETGKFGKPNKLIVPNAIHVLCRVGEIAKSVKTPHPRKHFRWQLLDALAFSPPILLNGGRLNTCLIDPLKTPKKNAKNEKAEKNAKKLQDAVNEMRRRIALYAAGSSSPEHG